MIILTLTSDFGLNSFEIPALKGRLLNRFHSLQIVDISHNIMPFDTTETAHILKNSSIHYPPGTIHFAPINLKDGNNRLLLLAYKDQYYICPDNGIATLMFPQEDFKAYVLQGLDDDFSYAETYKKLIEVIAFAYEGNMLEKLGVETTSYLQSTPLNFANKGHLLVAQATYINSFGNAIFNIDKDAFYDFVGDSPFVISFRSAKSFQIHKHYSEVTPGSMVCLFNTAGLLEIAQNQGNAAESFGLSFGKSIMIEKL